MDHPVTFNQTVPLIPSSVSVHYIFMRERTVMFHFLDRVLYGTLLNCFQKVLQEKLMVLSGSLFRKGKYNEIHNYALYFIKGSTVMCHFLDRVMYDTLLNCFQKGLQVNQSA